MWCQSEVSTFKNNSTIFHRSIFIIFFLSQLSVLREKSLEIVAFSTICSIRLDSTWQRFNSTSNPNLLPLPSVYRSPFVTNLSWEKRSQSQLTARTREISTCERFVPFKLKCVRVRRTERVRIVDGHFHRLSLEMKTVLANELTRETCLKVDRLFRCNSLRNIQFEIH